MIDPKSDVRNIPIWDDCPFRDQFRDAIEIRKGRIDGFDEEQVIFWRPGGVGPKGSHIAVSLSALDDAALAHIRQSL